MYIVELIAYRSKDTVGKDTAVEGRNQRSSHSTAEACRRVGVGRVHLLEHPQRVPIIPKAGATPEALVNTALFAS